MMHGQIRPSGELTLKVLKGVPPKPTKITLGQILREGFPHLGLPSEVNRWRLRNCWRLITPTFKIVVINRLKITAFVPSLSLKLIKADGTVLNLGLASLKVVTDAGVAYITADMNAATGSAAITNFKYHGFGTGTTAENANQTALVTELTTEYVVNSTRPTGSQANSTNTYTTVGTLAPDSGGTLAITEHGIFSATSSTTLLDRSVFSAVNLVASADSLQATYVLTLPSGS